MSYDRAESVLSELGAATMNVATHQAGTILGFSPGELLSDALCSVVEHDGDLLTRDVSEIAVCSRLQMSLASLLEDQGGIKVDIEYNKNELDPKGSYFWKDLLPSSMHQTLSETAFTPDILIHQRGNHDYNLLAVEVKKKSCGEAPKLRAMTKCLEYATAPFCYSFVVYLEIDPGARKLVSDSMLLNGEGFVESTNTWKPYAVDLVRHYQRALGDKAKQTQHSLPRIKANLFSDLQINAQL